MGQLGQFKLQYTKNNHISEIRHYIYTQNLNLLSLYALSLYVVQLQLFHSM